MNLFKFQPINNYTLMGLINQTLFYGKPSSLNDPLEFQMGDEVCSNEFLTGLAEKGKITLSNNPNHDREKLRTYIKKSIDEFGVLSLTARDDSQVMWAHYAANHKGICLGFDFPDDLVGEEVDEVIYNTGLPILEDKSSVVWSKETVGKVMLTKNIDWQYEKEYRIIEKTGNESYSYSKNTKLQSVAFGLRSSKEDIELVKHVLAGKRVKFRQAQLDMSEFKISFHGIDL